MVGWIVLVVSFLMTLGLTVLAAKGKKFQEKKNGTYGRPEVTYGPISIGGMSTFLVVWWLLCAFYIGLLIQHTAITLIITGIALAVGLTVFGIIAAFDPNSSSAKLWNDIKGKLTTGANDADNKNS